MFEEVNPVGPQINPPVEPQIVSETLTQSPASETLAEPIVAEPDSVPEPILEPVVPTPVKDDSAQARIRELNKEAMNHRLKRDEYKAELDRTKEEAEQLRKLLEMRGQEIEQGKTTLASEIRRIAAEKDAEILRQKAEAEAIKIESFKMKIGMKYRLPESLWPRLSGTTAEEIDKDAFALKQSLPQESLNNDSTVGINQQPNQPSIKDLKEARKGSYRM